MPRDSQEQGQQAPRKEQSSGELTDMFGSLQPVASGVPTGLPLAPVTAPPDVEGGGFTALFSTGKEVEEGGSSAAEAPTQMFAAQPATPAVRTSEPLADQTVLFTPVTREAPAVLPAPPPSAAGEFTQIFRPIPPPAVKPAAAVPPSTSPAPSGEFTQFFSAVSARQAAGARETIVAKPAVPTLPPASAPAPTPVPSAAPAGAFTQMFSQLAPPTPDRMASSASAGSPLQPFSPAAEAAEIAAAPAPLPQALEKKPDAPPGAFTQMFSQLTPPVTSPQPISSPVISPPVIPTGGQPAPPPVPAPMFGAPIPRGSFTEGFQTQSAASASAAPVGGFTELFRSPPSAPPAAVPPAAPAPEAYPAMPASFGMPPQPAPAAAGAGDFTRLMQSLEHPKAAAPMSEPPAAPFSVDAAFFQGGHANSVGESEYTRVMRGGGAGQGGSGLSVPSAGSAHSPGLLLAPAAKENDAASQEKLAKAKPKPLVLLLVVMNVLLLLALVVIGIVVLRHK